MKPNNVFFFLKFPWNPNPRYLLITPSYLGCHRPPYEMDPLLKTAYLNSHFRLTLCSNSQTKNSPFLFFSSLVSDIFIIIIITTTKWVFFLYVSWEMVVVSTINQCILLCNVREWEIWSWLLNLWSFVSLMDVGPFKYYLICKWIEKGLDWDLQDIYLQICNALQRLFLFFHWWTGEVKINK